MSTNDDNENNPAAPAPSPDSMNLKDLVVDLNFTPTWARSGAAEVTSVPARHGGDRDSGRRPPRDRDRDRRGPPSEGGKKFGGGGPRRDRPARDGEGRDNREGGRGGDRGRRGFDQRGGGPREERVVLPIEISFIPDRDRLGAVVKQLHAVKRAFPLPYVAGLFLSKPAHHMLKLEVRAGRPGAENLQFYQCRQTKVVFLKREDLMDYLVRTHLDAHFERVELAMEPPVGNFVCVGQCRKSGVILGPPNYHGYTERLQELHRTRFAHLTMDQYRNQIEMVRDPAVIEKWKDECRTQVRYRSRETPEAEANLTLAQAQNQFLEKHAAGYVNIATKVIMPASAVELISDPALRQAMQSAWMREDRFPFSLMLALRPAFRRMRLCLFKAGKDETFVTSIQPKPFDAEHAIPAIKDMVALITEHPGWNRRQLVEKLYPGKPVDDPEVVEKMASLAWLIDKGHIIEFFNGTYAIPGHLRQPGAVPTEAPQEHHHPEPEAGVAADVVSTEALAESLQEAVDQPVPEATAAEPATEPADEQAPNA